jgi:hypothetical protein
MKDAYNESKDTHQTKKEHKSPVNSSSRKKLGERARGKEKHSTKWLVRIADKPTRYSGWKQHHGSRGISGSIIMVAGFNGVSTSRSWTNQMLSSATPVLTAHWDAWSNIRNRGRDSKPSQTARISWDALMLSGRLVSSVGSGAFTYPNLVFFLEKTSYGRKRRRWLELGLSTLQPKWHLTFVDTYYYVSDWRTLLAQDRAGAIERGHNLTWLQDRFCVYAATKITS